MKLSGEKILIIGGTGSLGRALTGRLSKTNKVFIVSRDELKQWTMRNEMEGSGDIDYLVCDMRDAARLEEVLLTTNPHLIIIAAALKQVDTCERTPGESIKTNILGVQNLVEAVERNRARLSDLEVVLMVSTDKACEPTNVYGMSKAIAERIVTSRSHLHTTPRFVAVRYGNVLESRGSIIPLYRYQAEHASALTLTHEDMTRFVMTLDESIDLIMAAVLRGQSGETWIPKLKAMRVKDLADIFASIFSKPVKVTGIRPGEKLHETLISETESLRLENKDSDYVALRGALAPVNPASKTIAYTSTDDLLSREALEKYLTGLGILSVAMDRFVGAKIEEIRPN